MTHAMVVDLETGLEIEPTEPIRRHAPEEIGLLDESELAARLPRRRRRCGRSCSR